MKPQNNQILVHVFAILGTGTFWLGIEGGVSFLTKGSISPLTLVIHTLATTLIAYGLDAFKQRWTNRDFILVTLFRPITSISQPNRTSTEATNQRNPVV